MPAKVRISNPMLLLYNLGVSVYFLLVLFVSIFNKKAKLWINGRKNTDYRTYAKSAWFHFASLGEYEQGLPVLIAFKSLYPDIKIIITFFSPSGFEIRKNSPFADAVYYLPLDTKQNIRRFLSAINPVIAVFTKYEYWYHVFNELHKREVPLYIISGIFRPSQVFFKWYGSLHRKMLQFVTCFFVQNENSKELLRNLGINNVLVNGDTRFDRVWANAQQPKQLPIINQFKNNCKVFIGGSTWPEDEELLISLIHLYPDWKFIFAPHEINEEAINDLCDMLPAKTWIKYSQLASNNVLITDYQLPQILIIDNIGMLSSLYQYGDIAFVGGGFGAGIHNTLEAASYGLPVIFGPNYTHFKEACDLIEIQAGFSVNNANELKLVVARLTEEKPFYDETCHKAREYVRTNTGATKTIIKSICTLEY